MVGVRGPSETDDFIEVVRARVASPSRIAAVQATGLLDTDPEPAFDRIAALAARLCGAPSAFVTLVDDRRSFRKAAVGAVPEGQAGRQTSVNESFCQYVIGLDDELSIDDVRLDPRAAANPSIDTRDVGAWAGVPLRSADGEVIGTVCVVDPAPRAWSAEECASLSDLAAIAAGEMTARATTMAARRAEALLEAIVERASIGFCLVDDDLRYEMINDALAASNGLPAAAHLGRLVRDVLPRGSGPIIDGMQSIVDGRHDALEVELVGEVPGHPGRRQAFRSSYFRVDLGDGVRRVAALVSDETERAMSRRRAEILAELTRHLAIADDIAAVAGAVQDLAGDYVGARTVAMALADSPHDRLEIITEPPRSALAGSRSVPIGDGPCAEALRTRTMVVVESRAAYRRRYPGTGEDHLVIDSEATVVVPMRIGSGTPVGVVAFGWRRTIERDELPLRQIDTLVDVVTQAVERIRAGSQRRELIAGLQRIVLATPETRPGLDVAVRYVPAAATLGFGGDWYDVVAIDDSDRTALVVGDVVGHDAAAAVRMTETRAVMRQLLRLDTPLDALFARAGELLPVGAPSALATVVVVVVDPAIRTLRAASAGHLPPLLVDAHGDARRLGIGLGPFLGIAGIREAPVVTSYGPGSTLVCYSDGLVESRWVDIGADVDVLIDALAGTHRRSCEELATDLVDRYVDADALADDVALVVARL
jgi:serine phosphatase RsbU (regulator of sigma subunit)/PAS domain-containing protein